ASRPTPKAVNRRVRRCIGSIRLLANMQPQGSVILWDPSGASGYRWRISYSTQMRRMNKKYLKAAAPVLVLALGFGVVQIMSAAKPALEKKEETQRLVSLLYTEAREQAVHLAVGT